MPPPVDTSHRPGQLADGLPWWAMEAGEVAARLGSDRQGGLSGEEAARRLAATGPNALRATRTRPPWLMFLAQFTDTMIVVLLAAAVVTAIVGY